MLHWELKSMHFKRIQIVESLLGFALLYLSAKSFKKRNLHLEISAAFILALYFGSGVACLSSFLYVLTTILKRTLNKRRQDSIQFSLMDFEFSHLILIYLCIAVYIVGKGFDPVLETCILDSGDIFFDAMHNLRELTSCSDEIEAAIHIIILLSCGELLILVLSAITMNILFRWELSDLLQELIQPKLKVAILKSICVPFVWIAVSRIAHDPSLPLSVTWR